MAQLTPHNGSQNVSLKRHVLEMVKPLKLVSKWQAQQISSRD